MKYTYQIVEKESKSGVIIWCSFFVVGNPYIYSRYHTISDISNVYRISVDILYGLVKSPLNHHFYPVSTSSVFDDLSPNLCCLDIGKEVDWQLVNT